MKQQIETIIISSIGVINYTLNKPLPLEEKDVCPIYGSSRGLDSISLVGLISIVEDALESELGYSVIIADEKAISRRNSPFLTVGTLTNYIYELIKLKEKA